MEQISEQRYSPIWKIKNLSKNIETQQLKIYLKHEKLHENTGDSLNILKENHQVNAHECCLQTKIHC